MSKIINAEIIETLPMKPADEKCNARNKDKTSYCQNPAGYKTNHLGEGRCHLHGGRSLKGVDHPAFEHGKYSKYSNIPDVLKTDYERFVQDEEILDLNADIALADSIINDLLSKINSHKESDHWYSLMTAAFTRLHQTHQIDPSSQQLESLIADLGVALYEGQEEREAYKDIIKLQGEKRRLHDTELKRRIALHGMVKVERVRAFVKYVISVIREEVPDRRIRSKIASKLQKKMITSGIGDPDAKAVSEEEE
jgi:hypothetical protein